jgi:signal transduction histidine kinase
MARDPQPAGFGRRPMIRRVEQLVPRNSTDLVLDLITHERDRLREQVIHAEEAERRRIAKDVHDDTLSTMAAVGFECARLRGSLTDHGQIEIADGIARAVDAAADRLRSQEYQLEPDVLHREGLGSAIRVLLEDLARVTGADVRLDDRMGSEMAGEESATMRTVAFRVAKEVLANVRKHARAGMVHVAVTPRFRGINVRITDDGLGFDVLGSTPPRAGHLGLSSMRERIEEAGGSFHLDSCPGLGTTVDFWLPCTISEIQERRR